MAQYNVKNFQIPSTLCCLILITSCLLRKRLHIPFPTLTVKSSCVDPRPEYSTKELACSLSLSAANAVQFLEETVSSLD